MRNKAESKKGQSGQILIYTTIIVMLAALILVPLMQFAFTSHRSAQIREERTLELYASDAGIEDALYQIKTEKKGTDLANLGFGNSSAYNPGTPGMNDRTMDVTVQKVWLPEGLPANAAIPNKPTNPPKDWRTIPAPVNNDTPNSPYDTDKSDKLVVVGMLQTVQATAGADDFDHGWPNGVSQINGVNQGNWTGNWTTTGSASLASGGASGSCLKFTDAAGNAMRQVTLPKYLKPELKFDAKASSFEAGDSGNCSVSSDGGNWTTVATWLHGNETSNYKSFDIDLSQYGTGDETAPLWIRFDANLSVQAVASDDFNTGTWTGGSGWSSASWTTSGPSGSASVVTTGVPNSYQAKLTSTGEVRRKVSLAGLDRPSLTFWAKTSSFGATDTASIRVSTKASPTASDWTIKQTFNNNQLYATYSPYTLDLSQYQGNSTFWISFLGNMGSSSSAFASDNFESGWPNSGSGWAGSWTTTTSGSGDVALYSGSSYVHGGTKSLQLRSGSSSGTASATRIVNIAGQSNPRIQFYARNLSTDSGDTLSLQVSANGSSWTTISPGVTSSYQSFSYNVFDYVPAGTTQLWVRFYANMDSSSSGTYDYYYIDDISILGTPCFYFDDVSINEGDSFSVDNVWIGYQANSDDIEIAYIDPNFDTTVGSPGVNDPAYLDRIGVWMPPGCEYIGVVGNQTTQGLNQVPDILPATYAGGTILEWDFSPAPNLGGIPMAVPIVWDLTFSYSMPPTQVMQGMFIWLEAHEGPSKLKTYLSWDKGYEIYKAVSQAHSEIYGTNTQVTAYAAQGEVNKRNAASYGNYLAIGNTLLKDNNGDSKHIRESTNTPSYSTISSIPNDAEIKAAWIYWSAFRTDQAVADTEINFLYPKEYGPETFAVQDGNGNDAYITAAYTAHSEPIVTLPRDIVVNLYPRRYCGEILGTAQTGNGNDTFFIANKPVLQQPQAKVWVDSSLLTMGTDYVINYNTGNVTIIKNIAGQVKINYSVSSLQTLTPAGNYTVNYASGLVTITNDCLAGNVTIDYWASHWSHNDPVQVTHAAYDRYGTSLPPVVYDNDGQGWSYACFRDVTDIVKGTGNGKYGVTDVYATVGDEHQYYTHGQSWPEWCYSGWSLVIIYDSPQETAHKFYLYDPIHNDGVCPFYSGMNTEIPFNLTDFYPPDGLASGRLTYFVGEGDDNYDGDKIKFKGDSQPPSQFKYLSGSYNPDYNIMNNQSSNGEQGVDIDTFDVTHSVGADTTANIVFETDTDSWNLVYIVLSFKTNEVPKPDYSFNVASVTYQYELGN